MKKHFLSVFVFLFLFVQAFSQPQLTFAAGETYTWINPTQITMAGTNIANGSVTLTVNGNLIYVPPGGSSITGGHLFVASGSSCSNGSCHPVYNCAINFKLTVSSDGKTGVTSATAVPINGGTSGCTPAIINAYNNQHITITGNPNNTSTPETQGQKAVCISIDTPNGNSAPANLTVTIGGQKKTLTKTLFNANGVEAQYNTNTNTTNGCFELDPGNYTVCAPPILPCNPVKYANQKFQKIKYQSLNLKFDEAQVIGVNLNVHVVSTADQTCNLGPYTLVLKQRNNTVKTIKTNTINQPAADPNANLANIGNGVAHFTEQFNNVADGTYQVCAPDFNVCKSITTSGNNSVTLDGNIKDSSKICTIAGNPTPLPPPPSPPCRQWSGNGICQTFGSTFGGFSTDPSGFIQKIFAILLSVSGGIALLLIIKAGYQLMTAQGKPEQLQNGRDQLIAAIVGLVFLIFSFVFLQLIGFDILHIPGFNGPGGTSASAQSCAGAGMQYCSKAQQCFPASSTCP